MKLDTLIECTAYDYKSMLEEKKPKSWLKSVSAFDNGLGGLLFFGIEKNGIDATADSQNGGDHGGDLSETKLTKFQQIKLNLIKESPTITGKQMSEMLSVSKRTIERDLSALQKIVVLKCEGKGNDGVWVIGIYSRKIIEII